MRQFTVDDLITFDCRVGAYQTEQEAVSLLLCWRAYDCSVNGVSDAVFRCKGNVGGAGQAARLSTVQKLQWLHNRSLLPLPLHQRQGSYFGAH
jgi:tRNA(His) 5'-end guanylyltransferase